MHGAFADPTSLRTRGLDALRAGDAARAKALIEQALTLNAADAQGWLDLALALARLGDAQGELAAIDEALKLTPRSLPALLRKAEHFERAGRGRRAAQTYAIALQLAPAIERAPMELRASLRRALEARGRLAAEQESFLRAHVAGVRADLTGQDVGRFDEALEVVLGKKAIYRQRPLLLFWPGLPAVQFYPRQAFRFLDAIEDAVADITEEFLEIQRQDEGVGPYVAFSKTLPQEQWGELNHSRAWSAYHLIKDGERVEDHCRRCPRTAAALALAPAPAIRRQNPVAMFSILEPRTRIPPHTGATNARLVCHLPLVVPPGCGFRVGNETRAWVPGKAWVFDDTIEHEAWNDSGQPRAILIFDIWNPYLNEAERQLIPTLIEGMLAFREDGDEAMGSASV
jgi:aspartate beta-hydroxylase